MDEDTRHIIEGIVSKATKDCREEFIDQICNMKHKEVIDVKEDVKWIRNAVIGLYLLGLSTLLGFIINVVSKKM